MFISENIENYCICESKVLYMYIKPVGFHLHSSGYFITSQQHSSSSRQNINTHLDIYRPSPSYTLL